jgi:hypothetical protein
MTVQWGVGSRTAGAFQEKGRRKTVKSLTWDPVLLAYLLVGLLMRAIDWWHYQDEPGPDVMADQILFLLEHGLPPSLLTGTGHLIPARPLAEH